jgi:phosphoglycolate phosphatase
MRAVIFDLDGTLLDTIGDIVHAANRVLRSEGYPEHSEPEFKEMVGDGIHELVARMLPESDRKPERVLEVLQKLEEEYGRSWADHSTPFPGISLMLNELARRGSNMAILSNKPHSFTILMVEHLLSEWRFNPVWGVGSQTPKKPNPTGALAIAEQWGCQPCECYFVGDSEPDIRTAKAAGMISVAVAWGFRSQERLKQENPDYLITEPMELLKLSKVRLRME